MHCASLGEFEQGKPVLESLRKKFPNTCIVLTFFSPSGFENVKNYPIVDYVFYLPADSAGNAARFIDSIQPDLVLWVKYEYWYYYLAELKKRKIPVLLISGVFRNNQPFFKWYGNLWRKMLQCFAHFFVQTPDSVELLKNIGITGNISLSGDTRFDRVLAIAENNPGIDSIKIFCQGHKVIVAGSTWEDDEAELVHFVKANPEVRCIIAPHETDSDNIRDVLKTFPGSVLYSEYEALPQKEYQSQCLIIDCIGLLSRLYCYADICYVGGGFGDDGVHNVLEAAVYGKPVIFGPVYDKYIEACELIDSGGGISIENALELEKEILLLFSNNKEKERKGEAAAKYVRSKTGATQKIMDYIQEKRLLTN